MPTPVTSITLARPQRGLALPPRLLLPRLLLLLQLLLGLTTICTTVSAGTVTKLKRNVDVVEHAVKLDEKVLDKALIAANIARLYQDCGSTGRFGFCPRNLVCLQYADGMWDIGARRRSPCDPANDADFGCHCENGAFSNGSCSSEECVYRMRRYFMEQENAEDKNKLL